MAPRKAPAAARTTRATSSPRTSPTRTASRCRDSRDSGSRGVELPRWAPIHIGNVAIDISPTKHVVMLLLAALLCFVMLITPHAHTRGTRTNDGRPRGFADGIEAMVLYIRQEVALPNLGHHGEGYAPFILGPLLLHPVREPARPHSLRLDGDRQHLGDGDAGDHHVLHGGVRGHARAGAGLHEHDLLLDQGPAVRDAGADVPADDADRAHREVHEAVRARDPSVREHDGGPHRRARADRADLRVQELRASGRRRW